MMRFLSLFMSVVFLTSCHAHAQSLVAKPDAVAEANPAKVSVLVEAVDEANVEALISKLEELKSDDNVKEIWVKVNSFGGSVIAGNKLIDEIKSIDRKEDCMCHFSLCIKHGCFYHASVPRKSDD